MPSEKELEVKLKEQKERAEAIVSLMGEGLLVIGNDNIIELINPAAQKLLDIKAEDAIGKKWSDVTRAYVGDMPLPIQDRSFYKTLKEGSSVITSLSDNHYYETLTGRRFPVISVTTPLIGVGAIKVFRDATKERNVDRMKTEFISLASHQLRTPLSAIKWFTEMLLSGDAGKLTNEQEEFMRNIYDSTERMIQLVNSLLNISRIESGRIIIDPQPVDLKKLIEGVVADLKGKLSEKSHNLVVNVYEGLSKINLDPRLIGQVYLNLLTNAIKYTPNGGEIHVFISKKGKEIITQVSDNGYGIPKHEQDKIFQKFFRADNVVKVETEGAGLGLYLVKGIIESSGGKIWFESEEGKGTTFWFSLPVTGMQPKKGEVVLDS